MLGNIELCKRAESNGAKNYDIALLYAVASDHENVAEFARANGARAKFAVYGAAFGHRAEMLQKAYKLEESADEKSIPLDVMECINASTWDYSMQRECDMFIATARAVKHDRSSITAAHLKAVGDPDESRCIALFRLACEHNCFCVDCSHDSDFAPSVNCISIWRVALECRKVTIDRIIEVACKKGTSDICRFALDHGASPERVLQTGVRYNSRDICELARSAGARDFRAMFEQASQYYRTSLIDLALEWSREPGQAPIDFDLLLRTSAYTGECHLCRNTIRCGARNVYEARAIAREYDHHSIIFIINEELGSTRDIQSKSVTGSKAIDAFGTGPDDESSSSEDDE